MTTNELLAVIDREADLLEADNWHAAAAVMRETAEHLRARAAIEACARKLHQSWSSGQPIDALMTEPGAAALRVPHHATPSRTPR